MLHSVGLYYGVDSCTSIGSTYIVLTVEVQCSYIYLQYNYFVVSCKSLTYTLLHPYSHRPSFKYSITL